MTDLTNSNPKTMFMDALPGKAIIAAIPGLWISIPVATKFLLIFMGFDILTGLIAGWIEGKLSSSAGRRGISIKALTLLLIATASLASRALKLDFDLGSGVAIAYIVNEVISIVENCARAGVPIPSIIVQALLKVKSNARNASKEDLDKLKDNWPDAR